MLPPDTLVHAVLGLAAAAALAASGASGAEGDPALRADLLATSQRRIFFGHQSVGVNVLDGLKTLSAREGVPLRIVEARPPGVPAASLAHAFMASNEKPRLKLQSFRQAFDSGAAAGAEIALLKFCYVDFDSATDVAGLFAAYQSTIAELKARYPSTTFVHVTAPLVAAPAGAKESIKQLLGRPPPPQLLENARREEYNELVRRAYQGREPVFDIARVESTRPDGGAEVVEWQGRRIPAMVARYTTDGGHLGEEGKARAARALASVLAAIPRPPAVAPPGKAN